jgi:mono/diheme cytochrome c family protein
MRIQIGIVTAMAVACAGYQSMALGADVAAGRAAAQAKCVACHEADDWAGEDAASLQSIIRDIVAGKVKHKQKIALSPAEIDNIAAYWAQGKR